MLFNEKLDFLMKITETTNSHLARVVKLDSSYISRLRNGSRMPAKKENYLKAFADYFAKNLIHNYQITAFYQATNIKLTASSNIPIDLNEIIYKWLVGGELVKKSSVDHFVEELSLFAGKKPTPSVSVYDLDTPDGLIINSEMYFGIDGKRDAVIKFLSLVLQQIKPSTLYLFSEEDMLWLTEKPEFIAKWAILMTKIIEKGNKIKIIHTVNRSLDEMLAAISQWLPLYLSGAIEPYYYPKFRDGVFKRTLFLAPETAAIVSSTIGQENENSANYLYTDKAILFSLLNEFNSYLSLCRPLIHIFNKASRDKYLSALNEFESEKADSIIKSASLSNITMPKELISSILSRSTITSDYKKEIFAYLRERINRFEKSFTTNKFVEVIVLPDIEDIIDGNITICFSDMANENQLFYTPKEYALHIKNIIRLLEKYDNYNVYLEEKKQTDNITLYVKEEVGVIIAKNQLPSVMFAINESNMTDAFWDYMNDNLRRLAKEKLNKENTILILKQIVDELN